MLERYLYEESHRHGGRVERIANTIADEMFANFYAEHDAEKARHRHNRKYAMAENKTKHRGGSKYLDFDWCTNDRPTRAQLKAETLKAEISCADVLNVPTNMPCIIFPDNELYCISAENLIEAEDVMEYCGYKAYDVEFRDGYLNIYVKEVA